MFAGIIERILLSYFGDYIQDFEKDKISIGVIFLQINSKLNRFGLDI